jgi:hypothetical protein
MEESKNSILHSRIVENYRSGRLQILINRSAAILVYAKLTRNPLVKLFQLAVSIFTAPPFILCAVVTFVFFEKYLFILYYVLFFSLLLLMERFLVDRIIRNGTIRDRETCDYLLRKGVISIRDKDNPDMVL